MRVSPEDILARAKQCRQHSSADKLLFTVPRIIQNRDLADISHVTTPNNRCIRGHYVNTIAILLLFRSQQQQS